MNLSDLNLCILAGTLASGGAERQLYYILKTLRAAQARVRLLTLTQNEFWENPIRKLGIPITWVGQSASRLQRLRAIIRVLKNDRPHVIQSMHFYTNLYVALAARLLSIPEVGAIRNDVISEVRSNGSVLGNLSLWLPRCLAVNSEVALQVACRRGVPRSRLVLLRNVVDESRFVPPEQRRSSNPVRLLAVGRLVHQKQHGRFLNLIARLKRNGMPIVGLLAGDGPLLGDLRQQARSLDLSSGDIEFCGATADMSLLYRQADLLVLTSDHEGTPNVVLEAMASGLPVVATRVGGTPYLLADGETGYLVEPGDADGLEAVCLRLIQSADLRATIGTKARQYVQQNCSLENLRDGLSRLYSMVLGRAIDSGSYSADAGIAQRNVRYHSMNLPMPSSNGVAGE